MSVRQRESRPAPGALKRTFFLGWIGAISLMMSLSLLWPFLDSSLEHRGLNAFWCVLLSVLMLIPALPLLILLASQERREPRRWRATLMLGWWLMLGTLSGLFIAGLPGC